MTVCFVVRLAWSCYLAGWNARQEEVDYLSALVKCQQELIPVPQGEDLGWLLKRHFQIHKPT